MGVVKSITKAVGSLVGGVLGQSSPSAASTPTVEATDPAAERLAAEREAAVAANTRAAERNKQRRAGSLLAAGGSADDAATQSVLARGKTRLGE